MANENTETIRQLCVASESRLPFREVNDVSAAFAHETEFLPPPLQWFANRLESLVVVSEKTEIHVSDIRRAALVFALEAAIERPDSNWEPTLISVANCTPSDKYLLPFNDSAWERAIDIGRRDFGLGVFRVGPERLKLTAP